MTPDFLADYAVFGRASAEAAELSRGDRTDPSAAAHLGVDGGREAAGTRALAQLVSVPAGKFGDVVNSALAPGWVRVLEERIHANCHFRAYESCIQS